MKHFFLPNFLKRTLFLLILGSALPFLGNSQNGALNFNGVDGFVTMGNVSSLKPTNTFTLEAWVYLTENTASQYHIISSGDDATNFHGYQLVVQNLTPILWVNNYNNACASSIQITLNNWHHIAATYNSSGNMKIYVDGVLGNTTANNGTVNYGTEAVMIGKLSEPSTANWYPWKGRIDEVRIWSVEKSQANIQSAYNCEFSGGQTNLEGYYRFNETTGTVANSPNGINGTLNNLSFDANSVTGRAYSPLNAGSITGNQNICEGSSATLTAAPSGGGSGPKSYEWISTSTANITVSGTASTTSAVAVAQGSSFVKYVVSEVGCLGALSPNYTVNALPLPTVTAPSTSFYGTSTCLTDNSTFGVTGNYSGGSGNGSFHWLSSNASVATIAGGANTGVITRVGVGSTNISYYYTDIEGCTSATSSSVAITITPPPAAPLGSSVYLYDATTTKTLDDITATLTGTSIKWYDAPTGGNLLLGTTTLVGGTTYYASQSSITCEGTSRLAVTASAISITINSGTSNVIGCQVSFSVSIGISGLPNVPTNTTYNLYWNGLPYGTFTTNAGVTTATVVRTQSQITGTGSSQFGVKPVGPDPTVYSGPTFTINAGPSAPTGSSLFTYYGYADKTLNDVTATLTGTNIKWYDNAVGGNLLPGTTVLAPSTVYFATQDNGTCESVLRLGVGVSRSITHYYVKPVATGNGSGDSWANATSDLGGVLRLSASGDQIWVAGGTYYPTRNQNYAVTSDRYRTFRLKQGVNVYGGFAGTESLLSERTSSVIAANPSVLSGDLGTLGNNSDNSFHVVIAFDVDNIAFDGFTIRDGNANSGSSVSYSWISLRDDYGAGLVCMSTTATFSNLTFTNNSALQAGGAVYSNSTTFAGTMTFSNCRFTNNTAQGWFFGSAYFSESTATNLTNCYFGSNTGTAVSSFPFGSYNIDRCVFQNNTGNNGGAFYIRKSGAIITNSLFIGNSANNGGGVFVNKENNESWAQVINCTFYGNSAVSSGNALWGDQCTIRNTIFNNNTGSSNTINGTNASSMEFCLFEAGTTINIVPLASTNGSPSFVNTSDLDGPDNIFGTSDDGLNIACGSAAYNSGTNSASANSLDLAGNPRTAFTTRDIGAYESTTNLTAPSLPTATNINAIYDGTLKTGSATVGGGETLTWYDAPTGGNVTVAPSGTNVGTYTAYAEAGNGLLACATSSSRRTVTVQINAADLIIDANDVTKTYGATLTGGSGSTAFTSSGLQNGETIGSVTIAYGTGAAATDNVGIYTNQITPSAATGGTFTATNYNITYTKGIITVDPANLTINANNQSKCFGSTFNFAGTEFQVAGLLNSDAVTSVSLASSGASAGASTGSSPYTISASNAVGSGLSNYNISYNSGSFTVWSNPTAAFTFNDADQCLTGNSFVLTNTSTNGSSAINSWVWSATGSSNAAPTGVGPHTVTYSAAGNYTVNLTVTDANGCSNATSFTNNVTLWENPTASFTIDDNEQCLTGNSFTVTNTSTGGTGTINAWSWSASGASPAPGTGVGPKTFSYASRGLKTVNLTVTDDNGCSASTVFANNIMVNGMPVPSFTINDNTQCLVGNSFTFTNTSTPSVDGAINAWVWSLPDANIISFTGAGPHTTEYATHGDYSVNLEVFDINGCSTTTSFTNNVRVFQHPTASFTTSESSGTANNDNNICTGATVTFNASASTFGFGASSLSYQWRRDNANATGTGSTSVSYSPVVNAVNNPDAITFGLRVTDNNGCTSHSFATEPTQVINVYPYAVPALTTPDIGAQGNYGSPLDNGNGGQLICNGAAIFSGSATIPSGSVASYVFNYGDGSGNEVVTDPSLMKHTFPTVTSVAWNAPGYPNVRYNIQMTAITDQGCSTSTTISRDIKTGPDASIGLAASATQSVTNNVYEFQFGNIDRHPSYKITNLWNFGDGTTSTASFLNITPKIYTTPGNYRTHLIIYTNTGCTDTAHYDVVVTPAPSAAFAVTPNTCANRIVSFNSGTSVMATSYAWNFGDGNTSTSANPTHTYASDGNYTVTLVINGGASTATQSVSVVSNPVAGTISSSVNSCTNEYTFTSNATGTSLTYDWYFSGGTGSASTVSSAQRTYASAVPTTVDLTVTANGTCSVVVPQLAFTPLAAIPGPDAGVSAALVSACSTSVTITNTSANANTFEVSVDNGSFTPQTTFPYNIDGLTPGVHTIILRASASGLCPDNASTTVTVAPVTAAFTSAPASCGQTVAFTNTSTVSYGAPTYSWNFNSGEGSSSLTSPSFSFATGGSKNVSLTVVSVTACSSSVSNSVAVSSLSGPTATFTHAASLAGCGNGRQFTNTTVGSGLTYSWDFGDNTVTNIENPLKYFASSGNHQVTLTVSDGVCSSSTTQTVTVSPFSGNAAAFEERDGNYTQSFSGNSFYFNNLTEHTNNGWTPSYSWNFGDGTTSTSTHIFSKSYAAPGTYTITLSAVSSLGCTTTFARTVTVNASNAANFSYTPNTCGSLAIAFNSSSSIGATSYSWNFGDGNTSTLPNPTHTYAAAGTYSVVLTINGSISSSAQTVLVSAAPTGVSITPSVNNCTNVYTFAGAATGTGLSYAWSFTNVNGSGASTGSSITRSYSANGTDNITLTVTSGACSTATTLSAYAVSMAGPLVTANLSVTASNACSGIRTINNTGSVGSTFQVSVDGGAYTVQSTFPYDVTGLAAGQHTIALKAVNGSCEDIDMVTFEVGSVTAAFTVAPSACNTTAAFTNTSTATYGTATYAWTFPTASPSSSTSTNPTVDYGTAGTKSATLVATLSNGCTSTATNNAITVISGGGPTPSFTSTFVNSSACSTGYVFTSTSVGATSYTWNFGDGTPVVNTANASTLHSYASAGTYTVTLSASNGSCANSTSNSVNVISVGNPIPDASISMAFTAAQSQCITNNAFYFQNESRVNSPEWMPTHSWNFGDGTTSSSTHIHFAKTYAAPGTYTVTLTSTATNGCSGTATIKVTVTPTPCAGLVRNIGPGLDNRGHNNDGIAGGTTGVNTNDISGEINLYPNPNTGNFKLSLGNIEGRKATLVIVDMLGREVYNETKGIAGNTEIEISDLNLADGKYNLIFTSDGNQVARKSFAVVK